MCRAVGCRARTGYCSSCLTPLGSHTNAATDDIHHTKPRAADESQLRHDESAHAAAQPSAQGTEVTYTKTNAADESQLRHDESSQQQQGLKCGHSAAACFSERFCSEECVARAKGSYHSFACGADLEPLYAMCEKVMLSCCFANTLHVRMNLRVYAHIHYTFESKPDLLSKKGSSPNPHARGYGHHFTHHYCFITVKKYILSRSTEYL